MDEKLNQVMIENQLHENQLHEKDKNAYILTLLNLFLLAFCTPMIYHELLGYL